ncbi:hypothetical protein HY745_07425 [Candidatus Desantisbacteria bacterium]|nr:hypothetical protein [Candidatus Desantisbacteria bacterium]
MEKITVLVIIACIFSIVPNVFSEGSNDKKQILIAAAEEETTLVNPSEHWQQNIGKKLDSAVREAYTAQLLKAGFMETTYNRYVKRGLSIEEAKKAISFDSSIGSEYMPGSLEVGERSIVFRMPYLTAVFNMFEDKPTETFIAIKDKVVNPKKIDGSKLMKK